MLTSQMGIMALNGGVHMATAFLDPKLPFLPQCEQGLRELNSHHMELVHTMTAKALFSIF